jgi:hypothetical protein
MEMSIMWKSDDGTATDDHPLNEWSRISIEAAKEIGKTFENAQFTKVLELQLPWLWKS